MSLWNNGDTSRLSQTVTLAIITCGVVAFLLIVLFFAMGIWILLDVATGFAGVGFIVYVTMGHFVGQLPTVRK